MTRKTTAEAVKKTRHRSPNHPLLSLPKAIGRAKSLFDKYGKHDAPMAIACEAWKMKANSSAGSQAVAALRA